ncbi:MAG: hypothetical protein N2515_05640, partial [Deltaproteobacteria bacterium]|nr:hypothetical protein [Deltaproteobacteria bacterium]
ALEIRSSFLDLLPEEAEPIRELREVLTHSRSSSDIAIAISAKDRALAEKYAASFVEEAQRDPHILGTSGHIDREWLKRHALLLVEEKELEEIEQKVKEWVDQKILESTGLYIDFESDGRKNEDNDFFSQIKNRLDEISKKSWILTR